MIRRSQRPWLYPLGALALMCAPALSLLAQNPERGTRGGSTVAAAPKPLSLEDYGRFNRIGGAALSSDGKWITYSYTPLDGQGTSFIENLDAGTKHTIERGSGIQFSDNSRWAGYFIDPPTAGRGGGGRGAGGGRGNAPAGNAGATGGAAPARTFELLDLQSGQKTTFPAVASFSFSSDGEWLLIRPQNPAAPAAPDAAAGGGRGGRGGGAPAAGAAAGSDLIMYNPASKTQRYIGNVGQSSFDDSGKLFAYTISGTQRLGNGVYVMTLATGEQKMLDANVADYDQLTWSAEGTHLAVLRGDKARDKAFKDNSLLVWTNVNTPTQKAAVFDPSKATGFPKEMIVSEFAALRFSEDGSRVWLGLKAQDVEWTPPAQGANVDVWHWNDATPQSQQIIQVNQDRRSTMSAVYDLATNTVRQVADSSMRQVTPTSDLKWAVGRNDKAYRGEIAWGGSHGDYYKINLATGASSLIEKSLSRTHGFSPDNKYWMYQQNGHVFVYDMTTGAKQQIDGNKNFVNVQDDHDYEKPIYGVAGWAKDGKSVLLYDRYDVWQLPVPAGTPVNLTKGEGAKQEITFRVQNYATAGAGGGGGGRGGRGGGGGGGGSDGLDLTKPLTLNGVGEWTKKEGYFDLNPGEAPKPIVYVDKNVGAPSVAKNADRMIFTQSTFNEFPDYWVSDKRFNTPKKVTNANPFLSEYAWGTKKLVEYKNRFGQRLQGTLTLPAGYEPGKKYPMLVYFYETMSQTHHNFSMPAYDDRPHISTYASNGYLVLQPDVVYEIGKPGTSAVDCVTAAVKEVIRLGYADPTKIGVQGHSWGGYQTSFMVTQTNMFAAIVTGAPPTNLVSFVGTTYPGSGTLQQGITEVGQVRMGKDKTPWNSEALYESQSPIHHVNKIVTPFMILHGTVDNAVDWHQGLEFYAAARRTGKNVILLSYPDEPHHLGRRENQLDFQVRMKQYFDHYLKGAPAPKWMTEGVPQVLKGREGLPVPGTQRATQQSQNQ